MYNQLSAIKDLKINPVKSRNTQRNMDQIVGSFHDLAEHGFQDLAQTQLVLKAINNLLKREPKNAEANAYFAYLLHLFQEPQKAYFYAQMACQLEPEVDEYLDLREAIESELDPRVSTEEQHSDVFLEEIELAYEEVEAYLHEWVHRIMQEKPLVATLVLPALEQLKQRAAQHQRALKTFKLQLNQLETEHDVQGLYHKLRPLEVRERQYQQVISISQVFYDLHSDIVRSGTSTAKLLHSLKNRQLALKDAEDKMEIVLDDCDRIADRLDDLDGKGNDISPVEPDYQELVASIAILQDYLEDIISEANL